MCTHKLCLTSEQMAGALVKQNLHLLLFSMMCDWREGSEGSEGRETDGEETEREGSALSPDQDEVESERDCEQP